MTPKTPRLTLGFYREIDEPEPVITKRPRLDVDATKDTEAPKEVLPPPDPSTSSFYRNQILSLESQGPSQRKIAPEWLVNDKILKVTCGDVKAHLHLDRFCSGTVGRSIREAKMWITPQQFEERRGLALLHDWQVTIRSGGHCIGKFIDAGLINIHPSSCLCSVRGPDPPSSRKRPWSPGPIPTNDEGSQAAPDAAAAMAYLDSEAAIQLPKAPSTGNNRIMHPYGMLAISQKRSKRNAKRVYGY